MRYLLAFDKFKDALAADDVVAVASGALAEIQPGSEVRPLPLTDGGEGFARILTRSAGGEIFTQRVSGPLGVTVEAHIGIVRLDQLPEQARQLLSLPVNCGRLGLVEMAQAAGLEQVPNDQRNPWHTTTYGVGQILRALVGRGVDAILIGLGGSATNDLGFGALAALLPGAPETPPDWVYPASWPDHPGCLEWSSLVRLPALRFACDVNHSLLGPQGATAIFGPQKGLASSEVKTMDGTLARMAAVWESIRKISADFREEAGAGAAGGLSYGLQVFYGGQRLPGADLVSRWQDWETHLDWSDCVLTGEGRVDGGFFRGKGPGALANAALRKGKKVFVLAGSIAPDLINPFPGQLYLYPITPAGVPLAEALPRTGQFLSETIRKVMDGS